jgi:4-nitrophenyl phosphatase
MMKQGVGLVMMRAALSKEMTDELKKIKGYLFDIDGVLLLGSEAIPGAKELLEELRQKGKHVLFVSNTSSRSREQCVEQFANAGIEIDQQELFLASEETSQFIARQRSQARACVIGSPGLFEELRKEGIDAQPAEDVDPEAVDFVVVGKDRYLTYAKLTAALRAINHGAKFVAVNCDPTVPGQGGLEPGAGAIVAAISSMVGRGPDINMGKPATLLLELAAEHRGLKPAECAMVGDSITIDIVAGNRLGMTTILVLSGNASEGDLTSPETLGEGRPDLVLPSVRDLLDVVARGGM